VTVSSPNKEEFYPPPELKDFFNATENLKAEFRMRWEGEVDKEQYRKVMENLEELQESLTLQYKEFYTVREVLIASASASFTQKQRNILRWLAENRLEGLVYTVLIDRLSVNLDIPKSTIRWNLRGLRESGLIMAGDREHKGIPVRLTVMGELIVEHLSGLRVDTEHI